MAISTTNKLVIKLIACGQNENRPHAYFLTHYICERGKQLKGHVYSGEILGLKWCDIDFDKKIIHVNRSLAYVPNKGYILTTLKTKNSKRQIPISDNVVKELLIHKAKQEEWKKRLGKAYEDNDLVICTEMGTMQDPRNILRVMRRLCKSSGVTAIRFHDILHTHASILISSGVDIVKVSSRLGHANPKITLEIYAHLLPNIQDNVAEIFENELSKHQ
ncbi:site-specific integrase [Bacillus smithii]|uniref:site-specific integrase n=1 Tax=Bacillus smithii TaxID=1479 RepID=UPI002E2291D7|nr:site-specific integrase [Bacillus smithii]